MNAKKLLSALFICAVLVCALCATAFAADTNLYVNSDYNSSTEGWGTTRFANYASAYTYATTNGKTSATIVVEKTTSLSGNTFDNNHKNYSKLAVVIKNGAAMGNALSTWDMTYRVTVEAGGTLTCARPKSSTVSSIHIKNKLIIGTKDSDKKAYCYLLSDSYQDCDISIRYNGSVTVYNAVMTVQDLDAQGKFTAEDSEITVDGAFASATFLAATLTDSTMQVKGTQISGGLSDFAGGTANQLGNVTLSNSSIEFGDGSAVNVAANVKLNGTSSITADTMTIKKSKKLSVNDTSSVTVNTLINDGSLAAAGGTSVSAETVSTVGTVTIDGKEASFNNDGKLVLPVPVNWLSDTDSNGTAIRFLFAHDIDVSTIKTIGIKYVKGTEIGTITESTVYSEEATTASAFYGDLVGIKEGSTEYYSAIAYVIDDAGNIYFSNVVTASAN